MSYINNHGYPIYYAYQSITTRWSFVALRCRAGQDAFCVPSRFPAIQQQCCFPFIILYRYAMVFFLRSVAAHGEILFLRAQKKYPKKGHPCCLAPVGGGALRFSALAWLARRDFPVPLARTRVHARPLQAIHAATCDARQGKKG